jgi:hypothetical protein
MNKNILAISGSVMLTLITGWIPGFLLFTETTGFRVLMGPLVGASNYGLPLVWRTVIVYPGSPTNYHLIGLIADVVIWALVLWLVLGVQLKRRK